ncbi:hypothetical protein ACOMHN_046602 [Nucella lapillus]
METSMEEEEDSSPEVEEGEDSSPEVEEGEDSSPEIEDGQDSPPEPGSKSPQGENDSPKNASEFPDICVICGEKEKIIRNKNAFRWKYKLEVFSKARKQSLVDRMREGAKKLEKDDILRNMQGRDVSTPVQYHRTCIGDFLTLIKRKPCSNTRMANATSECLKFLEETVIQPRLVDLQEVWPMAQVRNIFRKCYKEKIGYRPWMITCVRDLIREKYPHSHIKPLSRLEAVYIRSHQVDRSSLKMIEVILSESDSDSESESEPEVDNDSEPECYRHPCHSVVHRGTRTRVGSDSEVSDAEWIPSSSRRRKTFKDPLPKRIPGHSATRVKEAKELQISCVFRSVYPQYCVDSTRLIFPFSTVRWETVLHRSEQWKETEAPEAEFDLLPEQRVKEGYHDYCYKRFTRNYSIKNALIRMAKKNGTFQKEEEEVEILPRLRTHRAISKRTSEAVAQKQTWEEASQVQGGPEPKKQKLDDSKKAWDTDNQREGDHKSKTQESSRQEGSLKSQKQSDSSRQGDLKSKKQGDSRISSEKDTEKATTQLHPNTPLVTRASKRTMDCKRDEEGRGMRRIIHVIKLPQPRQNTDKDTDSQTAKTRQTRQNANRATGPKMTDNRGTGPKMTDNRGTGPKITDNRATGPKMTDNREGEPEGDMSEPEGDTEPEGDGSEPEGDRSEPEGDRSEPEGDSSEPEGDSSEPEGDSSVPKQTTRRKGLPQLEKASQQQQQRTCAFEAMCQGSGLVLPFTDRRWRRALECSAAWKEAEALEGKVVLEDRDRKGYHQKCYLTFTLKARIMKAKALISSRKRASTMAETENETAPQTRPSSVTMANTAEQGRNSRKPGAKVKEEKKCICEGRVEASHGGRWIIIKGEGTDHAHISEIRAGNSSVKAEGESGELTVQGPRGCGEWSPAIPVEARDSGANIGSHRARSTLSIPARTAKPSGGTSAQAAGGVGVTCDGCSQVFTSFMDFHLHIAEDLCTHP